MTVSMETARICQVQNNNSAICISVCLKMKVNHLGMTLVMFVFLRGFARQMILIFIPVNLFRIKEVRFLPRSAEIFEDPNMPENVRRVPKTVRRFPGPRPKA